MRGSLIKALGPGILFASTAIGVSHLVQSTRAGAIYGFALVWAIVLANVMKYPFFEFGSRYANATGESIIDGYKRIGGWALKLYLLVTIGSLFFVVAAVSAVTAGFLDNLFGLEVNLGIPPVITVAVLLLTCSLILIIGRYSLLDSLIKVVATIMLLCTLIAFFLTLDHGAVAKGVDWIPAVVSDPNGAVFLIALMGWMPTAVDLSTWNSLWTVARMKQTDYRSSMKETLFDFNMGYVVSAVLAICFVTMGAFLFYGTGVELSTSSAGFAHQVVTLYTTTIGQWSYPIVAVAAFAIMFGTCIAVLDGYARSLDRCMILLRDEEVERKTDKVSRTYALALMPIAIGAYGIIYFLGSSIGELVDLATTISFLIAPFVAIGNLVLVHPPYVNRDHRPPLWIRITAYAGIIYLIGFSVFYFTL